MRKFLYILAALLVLIGISTNDVEARQDVYATTYLGNNWYVDQDSVKRVGDILNFTVYTTAGLSYKVTSSDDNYYNADVFYDNNKLVSDNGQSVWKSPGMMAAMRVARRYTKKAGIIDMSSITEHLVMEDMLYNLCLFFCFGKRK